MKLVGLLLLVVPLLGSCTSYLNEKEQLFITRINTLRMAPYNYKAAYNITNTCYHQYFIRPLLPSNEMYLATRDHALEWNSTESLPTCSLRTTSCDCRRFQGNCSVEARIQHFCPNCVTMQEFIIPLQSTMNETIYSMLTNRTICHTLLNNRYNSISAKQFIWQEKEYMLVDVAFIQHLSIYPKTIFLDGSHEHIGHQISFWLNSYPFLDIFIILYNEHLEFIDQFKMNPIFYRGSFHFEIDDTSLPSTKIYYVFRAHVNTQNVYSNLYVLQNK